MDRLLPIVREIAIFARAVLDSSSVGQIADSLIHSLNSPVFKVPYVNLWLSYILQDECFNSYERDVDYENLVSLRDQALVAKRRNDLVWVKSHKSGLDVLGPWERRAILFASSVLSRDEMSNWLKVAGARGDVIEHAISVHLRGKSTKS